MVLLLDNYDSFTYNLFDYLSKLGLEVEVFRNDEITIDEITQKNYGGIVISPGPGRPEDSGITMEVIHHFHTKIPILGICLGMQALGMYFGLELVKANYPFHGKVSTLTYQKNHPMFSEIQAPLEVCRYHSLVLQSFGENSVIEVLATTSQDECMAIAHKVLPLWGFQFHPEAILTTQGVKLLENWMVYFNIENNAPKLHDRYRNTIC